jgi:hypothetical protein
MRFDLPESIEAIRKGYKKQTRRRSTYWLKKRPGSRITIVHQGKLLGWATVRRTWRQRPIDMPQEDAWAEGYRNLGEFFVALEHLYPDEYLTLVNQEMTVIEFGDIKWRLPHAPNE